ncbi:hypothetical protein BOTBODRAFT_369723 [Botryobasidium botryosum FD-172 SS1]|uniref:Uncharacterized protein n=1 Tax=Botryobasidium botryosum (strain FD-172 SS1) TaxID=930990 RepID=A0A067MNQ1_BOTB1|nr:hypothetical protein BOTBODRAFT_369723 [Botryobasidium botryosum FD-172 SS1]
MISHTHGTLRPHVWTLRSAFTARFRSRTFDMAGYRASFFYDPINILFSRPFFIFVIYISSSTISPNHHFLRPFKCFLASAARLYHVYLPLLPYGAILKSLPNFVPFASIPVSLLFPNRNFIFFSTLWSESSDGLRLATPPL